MLFKLAGGILILAASGFLGYIFSQDCIRRPQELRALQGMLQILENEMNYMSNILSDAFNKIYRSSESNVVLFFRETILNLQNNDGISAAQAWEMSVKDNINKTALNKEDGEILIEFGKMLGNTDIEGQIKNIRLTLVHLKDQEEKAEKDRMKNGGMYRKLGILGGATIVIILL